MTHSAAGRLRVGENLCPVVHPVQVQVDDFEGGHQDHDERAVEYPCRQGGRGVLQTESIARRVVKEKVIVNGQSWLVDGGGVLGTLTMYVTKGEHSRNR